MDHTFSIARSFPPITIPAPILALAIGPDGLWAGGPGGIAHLPHTGDWEITVANLPVTSISALQHANGWLMAGGANGIARSPDYGRTWMLSEVEGVIGAITAIVAAPNVQESSTLLASSLHHGILRSTDGGQRWRIATFGLETLEVTALAWVQGEVVVAATLDGLYRSPNSGRAWRRCTGTEGLAFAAVAVLPNRSVVAAMESGGLLHSSDDGLTWTRCGNLPIDIENTSLQVMHDGTLMLGSTTHGLLRSGDSATTWTPANTEAVLSLASSGNTIYAGTATGVITSSDGGVSWDDLGSPALHDLRRLLIIDGTPVVVGVTTAPVRFDDDSWQELTMVPLPLTNFTLTPDNALLASSPAGLVRSTDGCKTWQTVLDGMDGCVAHVTLRQDGVGWAGTADGSRLLHTLDNGQTWVEQQAPFGVFGLAALQALPNQVVAATYDTRRQLAQFWRSFDNGTTWERGVELRTHWPIVATSDAPPLLTLGESIVVQQEDGHWRQTRISSGGVRRIVSMEADLIALTNAGIWISNDSGSTWQQGNINLPVHLVMDLAVHQGSLFVLLAGGDVIELTR